MPEVDTDDEDFLELTLLITFPRKRRIFHDHANHFEMYDDSEFFNHFPLFKTTAHCILDITTFFTDQHPCRYCRNTVASEITTNDHIFL